MPKFEKIKEYLSRMRNAEYKILEETEYFLQFTVKTEYSEKLFSVRYEDGSCKAYKSCLYDYPRPRWHHYHLTFEQEMVPCQNRFTTIHQEKWYIDEEDALNRIKILKNKYNY